MTSAGSYVGLNKPKPQKYRITEQKDSVLLKMSGGFRACECHFSAQGTVCLKKKVSITQGGVLYPNTPSWHITNSLGPHSSVVITATDVILQVGIS